MPNPLRNLLRLIVLIALSPLIMVIGFSVWMHGHKRPGRRRYGR